MLKKILWISLIFFSALILFIAVWPIPYTKWSGLGFGEYPTGDEDKTLAEQLGYSRDDIILIVHADDLAIHKDQTDGSLDVMKKGMDKTGSVMVPCPDFERVVSIWKNNLNLDLNLDLLRALSFEDMVESVIYRITQEIVSKSSKPHSRRRDPKAT